MLTSRRFRDSRAIQIARILCPRGSLRKCTAPQAERDANKTLGEAITKACRWQEQIESGEYAGLEDLAKTLKTDPSYAGLDDLAKALKLDRSYVGRMLPPASPFQLHPQLARQRRQVDGLLPRQIG